MKNKKKSKFFKFFPKKNKKLFKFYTFNGWNKSLVIKIVFNSSYKINSQFIKKNFPQIINKEKVFIKIAGKVKFKSIIRNDEITQIFKLN